MTADRKALLAALALHGLALLGARTLPLPPASVARPVVSTANVEVTLESNVAPVAPPSRSPVTPAEPLPARPASATARGESRAVAEAANQSEAEDGVHAAEGARAPAGSAATTIAWARQAPIDLGLEGTVRMAQVGPDKPGAPSAGGLTEGLDAADAARGIWRGGPVRSAVEEAARSPEAPVFGTATFAVAIGKDGAVSVDVMAANSDRSGWERLAPAVRDALTKRPLRLPPNSGLRVTVRVEASEQFPGGAPPTPPEKQGLSAHGTGLKLVETKDHIEIVLPSATLAYKGRKCGAGIGISAGGIGVGGGCEVGVAMRVVAARIVNEERL